MRDRFESLRRLLTNDGLFFLHLDDGEMAYAKVLLDEVFGRYNYCNTICMTTNDPSGFKAKTVAQRYLTRPKRARRETSNRGNSTNQCDQQPIEPSFPAAGIVGDSRPRL